MKILTDSEEDKALHASMLRLKERVGSAPSRLCISCQQPYEQSYHPTTGGIYVAFDGCQSCGEARDRARQWEKLCPALYRATDIDDPRLHRNLVAAVKAWNPGAGRGIGLCSQRSGIGKTRTLYWRLAQLHAADWKIAAATHTELCDHFTAAACKELPNGIDPRHYHKPQILFIDDLGKGRFTESQQTALFDLLEHRTGKGQITCFTTNMTADRIKSKLSEENGEALVRRIGAEFNDVFGID